MDGAARAKEHCRRSGRGSETERQRERERARPGRSGAVCGAVRDQAERGKRKRAIEQWRPGYRRFAAALSSSRLMAGKKRRLQLQLQSRTHKGAAQTLQSSRAAHWPFAQKKRRTTHALNATLARRIPDWARSRKDGPSASSSSRRVRTGHWQDTACCCLA